MEKILIKYKVCQNPFDMNMIKDDYFYIEREPISHDDFSYEFTRLISCKEKWSEFFKNQFSNCRSMDDLDQLKSIYLNFINPFHPLFIRFSPDPFLLIKDGIHNTLLKAFIVRKSSLLDSQVRKDKPNQTLKLILNDEFCQSIQKNSEGGNKGIFEKLSKQGLKYVTSDSELTFRKLLLGEEIYDCSIIPKVTLRVVCDIFFLLDKLKCYKNTKSEIGIILHKKLCKPNRDSYGQESIINALKPPKSGKPRHEVIELAKEIYSFLNEDFSNYMS